MISAAEHCSSISKLRARPPADNCGRVGRWVTLSRAIELGVLLGTGGQHVVAWGHPDGNPAAGIDLPYFPTPLPMSRGRGLFGTDYEAATLRGNLIGGHA